eukprot:scaffold187707_cov28-Tisochrysis_lutea.AAC.5
MHDSSLSFLASAYAGATAASLAVEASAAAFESASALAFKIAAATASRNAFSPSARASSKAVARASARASLTADESRSSNSSCACARAAVEAAASRSAAAAWSARAFRSSSPSLVTSAIAASAAAPCRSARACAAISATRRSAAGRSLERPWPSGMASASSRHDMEVASNGPPRAPTIGSAAPRPKNADELGLPLCPCALPPGTAGAIPSATARSRDTPCATAAASLAASRQSTSQAMLAHAAVNANDAGDAEAAGDGVKADVGAAGREGASVAGGVVASGEARTCASVHDSRSLASAEAPARRIKLGDVWLGVLQQVE